MKKYNKGICKICGKNLSKKECVYCRKHYYESLKIKLHYNWNGGLPKCKLCGNILSAYDCKRCKKCKNIGKKLSSKTKIKISNKLKNNKNAFKNKKPKCKFCKIILINYNSKWCLKCFHKYIRGIKHWNYINGSSKYPYPFEFTKELKKQIIKRDNYTCQKCFTYSNKSLAVHHIDYNKQNCKENNLITTCKKCNSAVNFNRDYWYAYFTYINRVPSRIITNKGKELLNELLTKN